MVVTATNLTFVGVTNQLHCFSAWCQWDSSL
jgi:hypothetical protein